MRGARTVQVRLLSGVLGQGSLRPADCRASRKLGGAATGHVWKVDIYSVCYRLRYDVLLMGHS